MKLMFVVLMIISCFDHAEARIRMRKVKEAAKTCDFMMEDKLLSRPTKRVYSTERHSLIVEETVTLIKDKGEKICEWSLAEWSTNVPGANFNFYIDEFKGILYPYAKKSDGFVATMQVALSDCQLTLKNNVEKFEKPACERPKKVSRKKKSKKAKTTKATKATKKK